MIHVLSKEEFINKVMRDTKKKKELRQKGVKDADSFAINRIDKCLKNKRHSQRH